MNSPLKILHVNQQGGRGGAAGICFSLNQALLTGGYASCVLVGRHPGESSFVRLIEHDRYRSIWGRFCCNTARSINKFSGRIRGAQRLSERWIPRITSLTRFGDWYEGHEDFDYPGTKRLLEQASFIPNLLHLHNLHGNYFDLKELPILSKAIPTIITLHDSWMLAGHCSHSLECERWKFGCGSCPHLELSPLLRKDGSEDNWKRKKAIYQNCHLNIVCPSHWLADKVRNSILMPGIDILKVIPNGIDTSIFKPGSKIKARKKLGWPLDHFIVMFAANSIHRNSWKDFTTMRNAIQIIADKAIGKNIHFYALGEDSSVEHVGPIKIEFLPYRTSIEECYQATDVYLHAAKADTFPSSVIEAMACGTPVIATAVGGIPEQINDGETGFLVPAGDASLMAERIIFLMESSERINNMGLTASRIANIRFSQNRMVVDYLELYRDITLKWNTV